ncbi:EAL domain-containing protein [Mangrovitalea sediminis]|uniref:EAL domain-containing protein n=1 Tax=Mangrovitalea sediminis TaxID=1982043 RepID=UPI0018E9897E|nr:EAL domain-containing protein [Mangrovitalea sediminis]
MKGSHSGATARTSLFLPGRIWWLFLCLLISTLPVHAGQTVRVGVYENPPKIFYSDHHISGIFGQLLREIAERKGWLLQPVPCQWHRCLEMLKNGQLDLMPDVAINEQRNTEMDFGQVAALYSWSAVYRNPHVKITSIPDLKDKRIAVLAGSIQQAYLTNLIRHFGIRNAQLVPVETFQQGFQDASTGIVDGVVANNFYGDSKAPHYNLESTPVIFQPAQLFFAAPKGEGARLLPPIDHYLKTWQADSSSVYYRIIRTWEALPENRHVPTAAWWGLGLLGALLVAALGAVMIQRRAVKENKQRLRSTENKLAVILDSVDAYIYIKDNDLRYVYVNQKVSEFFKRPADQIIGLRDDSFFNSATASKRLANDQKVISEGERITFEETTCREDGSVDRSYLTVKQPLIDENGQTYGLCGIATDFTEQRKNAERINQLAFYDPLTKLPNRRLLLDRATHALANFQRTNSDGALLFIDLDNFKVLNDSQGHAQGDLLLEQVAKRLEGLVRNNDTMARLGGDEFVLLMENLGEDSTLAARYVEVVALKLLNSFLEPYRLHKLTYKIGASIGAAMFSDAEGSVEELFKRADMAMYEAKTSGRNLLKFFNHQMQSALHFRAMVEAGLQQAIESNHFYLHYQSQVDSRGQVFGAEALIRWRHPEHGLLSPADFIPIAEVTGQIMLIGDWVLRTACRQQVAWRDDPRLEKLVVSVNVSTRQFYHPDFVADVLGILDETGADPTRIELELTESVLAEDLDMLIDRMNTLREKGIRFSLDDFGTGYSSLSYLKRLPLDQLKIDQSFVRDLLTDPNDAAIVKSILSLGYSLDLAVVAEGVETTEQRDKLLAMGCSLHQGYYYGRPGPAEALIPVCSATTHH